MERITELLVERKDEKYADFHSRLIPTVDRERIIGVRTTELRKLAKTLMSEDPETVGQFIKELPHFYYDEYQLHVMIISLMKEYGKAMEETERILPYIDNWASCDQLNPKVFAKQKDDLKEHINEWFASDLVYTVRFAIGMLMRHFLDDDYKAAYPETVAGIRTDEYYINMMIAWYFATALSKRWEDIIPFIENRKLDEWTHNKTIQKAIESYRVSDEQKQYLRTLRIKQKKGKE